MPSESSRHACTLARVRPASQRSIESNQTHVQIKQATAADGTSPAAEQLARRCIWLHVIVVVHFSVLCA
jgi:hypothetical protein